MTRYHMGGYLERLRSLIRKAHWIGDVERYRRLCAHYNEVRAR